MRDAAGARIGTAHAGAALVAPSGALVAAVAASGDVVALAGDTVPGAALNERGEVWDAAGGLVGVAVSPPAAPNAPARCAPAAAMCETRNERAMCETRNERIPSD